MSSASCGDLQKKYYFTASGSTTPMQPGDAPRVVSARGTLDVAENGSFRVERLLGVSAGLKEQRFRRF
jgi:hypothetical protein